MKENRIGNIGLQFFAEGGQDDPGQQDPANSQGNPAGGQPTGGDPAGGQGNPSGTSYTQEQLNTMLANEKRTARRALLKELGFELKDDKEYKAALAGIKRTLDSSKTQEQLAEEARTAAETARQEAEKRAEALELRVTGLKAGVKPDCLEDAIAIVATKVSEDKTAEAAFAELKQKYPSLYVDGSSSGSGGTGNPNNPARKNGNGSEGLGKRLASYHKPAAKSNYFKS